MLPENQNWQWALAAKLPSIITSNLQHVEEGSFVEQIFLFESFFVEQGLKSPDKRAESAGSPRVEEGRVREVGSVCHLHLFSKNKIKKNK